MTKIHLSRNSKAICCHRHAPNMIDTTTLGAIGTSPWPWLVPATDERILEHICPTCDKIAGVEFRATCGAAREANRAAWEKIPEPIRLAVRTAHGGNRTVIRVNVPGYSSRIGNCVGRLCEEYGTTKQEIGKLLIAAGVLQICGLPIPRQWAQGEWTESGAVKIGGGAKL